MKRLLLSSILLTSCFTVFSQHYVENGGFENWENEGTDLVEPVEWNSFRTASGALNSFAPNGTYNPREYGRVFKPIYWSEKVCIATKQ